RYISARLCRVLTPCAIQRTERTKMSVTTRPSRKPDRDQHQHEGGRGAMKIRPLHDRILVERLEEKEVKKGGIIIPDTAKEKPQEGKVIAVRSEERRVGKD